MINPFNPGFGNISPSCIKRPAMQQKLLDQADQLQQGFRSIFIDGPRGCGKTVFLNDLGDAMLDRDGWITVDLELHDDFLSTLVGGQSIIKPVPPLPRNWTSWTTILPARCSFNTLKRLPSISSAFLSPLMKPISQPNHCSLCFSYASSWAITVIRSWSCWPESPAGCRSF